MSLWIDTDEALEDLCGRCAERGVAAVDTEFMWTSTYLPRLALVQIGWEGEGCALVDAPAIAETGPFRDLLEAPGVCKVLHDAASDLPILNRWCGAVPRNVFDTRIAAGFCGLTQGCSLGRLVSVLLGKELDKSETRSDWLQRPLTPEQLSYAGDDVKQLPALRERLEREVRARGNWECFRQEMAGFSEEACYRPTPPEDYWHRLAGDHLDGRRLAVLREVARWRETTARRLDRPRPRILSDSQIMEVVHLLPGRTEDLRKVTKLWPKMIRAGGAEIIDAVRRGLATPPEDRPRPETCHLRTDVVKERTDAVVRIVREVGESRGIDPALLGARKDAVAFVKAAARPGSPGCRIATGWRGRLLHERLTALADAWRQNPIGKEKTPRDQ